MRRKLIHCLRIAILLLPSSLLLQAQRGGGGVHSGGAAHARPSFSSPARTFTAPARSSFSSPTVHSPSFQSHQPRQWPLGGAVVRNRGGGVGYRQTYPLVYAGYPWLIPFGSGIVGGDEPGDPGIYQPPLQPAEPPSNNYEQMAENAPTPFRPQYQGQAAPAPEPARDQPTTTLIFRDGRSPAQVHNYALTATTLYALDGDTRKEIPLSVLDVPATVEANRAAGVDFALPMSH